MEFRIADTFTDSLARLTGDEQKADKTTAEANAVAQWLTEKLKVGILPHEIGRHSKNQLRTSCPSIRYVTPL